MARQREFDKQAVIMRAMRLFAANGYEATSIRDLKEAMQISSSSMYEAFGDKRGVFLAALAHFCELERAQISQMAGESPSPHVFIERLFRSVESLAAVSPAHPSLALNTMVEFGTRDPDVTKLLLAHYFGIAEVIAGVLAQAQRQHTIRTQESPTDLAFTMLSALQGVATVKGVKPDFDRVEAITQLVLRLLDS